MGLILARKPIVSRFCIDASVSVKFLKDKRRIVFEKNFLIHKKSVPYLTPERFVKISKNQ
jgi:hypothetical protein